MDLGGQVYHEKIMHALILMENHTDVGAIFCNLYCGTLNGYQFAIVVEQAYRGGYLTKPIVLRMKGRGVEEGYEVLYKAQQDFDQINIEQDWDKAAELVAKLAPGGKEVWLENQNKKDKEARIKAWYR
jgi:succinyl-CoA synthetase beta subunit